MKETMNIADCYSYFKVNGNQSLGLSSLQLFMK